MTGIAHIRRSWLAAALLVALAAAYACGGGLQASFPGLAQAQTTSANITAFRAANPGLEYVVLADITAGGTDDLYTRGRFGTSGTATTDSDLDLDTGDSIILLRTQTKDGREGGGLQLNHGGDLDFSDFVGTNGTGNDLTVYLMLVSNPNTTYPNTTYSFPVAGNVGRAGGGYVNLDVPLGQTPNVQVAWGIISTDTRFVFALARAASANNAPEFDSATATRTIGEDAADGANVGDLVAATDTDTDDALSYSISGDANFSIVSSSGQIQVAANASLNFEATPSHTVTVTASDGDDTDTIDVTNVDEAGSVALSSSQPTENAALRASLTDPDGSITGTSWQWASSSSAAGPFTNIDGSTSASYTPVAGDRGMYLRATASYTDGHGSGKMAEAVSGNAVAEVNDPPEFTGTATTRSVDENQNSGTNVGTPVTASDPGDTLTYSITGSNPGGFTIGSGSGQIQTGQRLDHEGTSGYTITVQAEDTAGQTDTTLVTISIGNVDEPGTVTLSSSQPLEGLVLTAALSDPDGSVSGLTWQWVRSGTVISGAATSPTTYTSWR